MAKESVIIPPHSHPAAPSTDTYQDIDNEDFVHVIDDNEPARPEVGDNYDEQHDEVDDDASEDGGGAG